jgi:hypothetical protein
MDMWFWTIVAVLVWLGVEWVKEDVEENGLVTGSSFPPDVGDERGKRVVTRGTVRKPGRLLAERVRLETWIEE